MTGTDQPLRIAYLAAGAGGMICGSCIHDNALVRALQQRGHHAVLLPIYTPLRTDEENVSYGRVFYGAVNIYLEQKLPLWSRAPAGLRRLLDNPHLLARVTRSAAATDARELGELALSMVRGEAGRQLAELQGLAKWLGDEFQPDVIHLTNSMLLGMVHHLREVLPGALIVCGLQGEDIFLEDLEDPHRSEVLAEMRRRVREVDVLVAPNEYYAAAMTKLLDLPPSRIDVARLGIDLEGHGNRTAEPAESPLIMGYLARMCPEKGFHLAAEAFQGTKRSPGPRSASASVLPATWAAVTGPTSNSSVVGLPTGVWNRTSSGSAKWTGSRRSTSFTVCTCSSCRRSTGRRRDCRRSRQWRTAYRQFCRTTARFPRCSR